MRLDAPGKLLATTCTLASTLGKDNPIRYRGYYYDNETGLYYLQSCYYDPDTGRFINADNVAFLGATGTALSCNLFAYCENNPVNCSVPNGCFYISLKNISKIILVFGINPIPAVLIGIGLAKLKVLIVAKWALLMAKLGAFWGPAVQMAITIVGTIVCIPTVKDIVEALWDCVFQGKKGIVVTIKRTRWLGIPYGFDVYAK